MVQKAKFLLITAVALLIGVAACTKEDPIIPVTSVKLDKQSLNLIEGESESLTATVSPSDATNKGVTWSSSESGVATVDANGKVTAVKAGSATITVKSIDGGKSANCAVTVVLPADVEAPTISNPQLSATEVTEEGFVIGWSKATDNRTADSDLLYQLTIKKGGETIFESDWMANKEEFTYDQVEADTEYSVELVVKDEAGNQSSYTTLTVTTLQVKSITIATQLSPMMATKDEAVTYVASTVRFPAGNYTINSIENLPEGVSLASSAVEIASDGKFTFTLLGSSTTTEGVYDNLRLTLDGTLFSNNFTLTIDQFVDNEAPSILDREIRVVNISYNSFSASWVKAVDNVTAQENLEYKLEIAAFLAPTNRYHTIYTSEWEKNFTYHHTQPGDNINPDIQYRVTVTVRDEAGNENSYDQAIFRTLEDPRTLQVAQQSGTMHQGKSGFVTFSVSGEGFEKGGHNITVENLPVGVTIGHNPLPFNESGSAILMLRGSSSTVEGVYDDLRLTIGSTSSNYFTLTIVHFEDDVRPEIPNKEITITNISQNNFSASWERATDNDTPQEELEYRFGIDVYSQEHNSFIGLFSSGWRKDFTSYPSHAGSDLQPNTLYQVSVTVRDKAGNERAYTPKEFTTLGTPKSLNVAQQSGTMQAGSTGFVTFNVTAQGFEPGTYDITVDNLPEGITPRENVLVFNEQGWAKLMLKGSATTAAGVYNNLQLTIDGTVSNNFTLTIQ